MNANEWSYLAEGGANIVFKYTSERDEKYRGKVLRIKKNSQENELMELAPLYSGFLSNLLSLPPLKMEQVKPSREFVRELLDSCDNLRPEHRKLAKHPEADEYWALLMPSLVENYTCEIKPKWSGRKHFHSSNAPFCQCRFCEAQLRKGRRLANESTAPLYCPQLFFSRNHAQVCSALESLFDKPSNQLRVFKNGKLCDEVEEREGLIDCLTVIISESTVIQQYIEVQHALLEVIDAPAGITHERYLEDISALKSNPSITSIPPYLRLLLAMTLRDASLMIAIENDEVCFIDLDIKPLEKLNYYFEEVNRHG